MKDTVLRGGYGIYRLPAIGYSSYGPTSQYAQTLSASSIDGGQNPPYYLQNGVSPATYNLDANGNANIPASLTAPSRNVTGLELQARTPYNQTWQIGFQRKLPGNWLVEAGLWSTRGVKLQILVLRESASATNLWGPGNLRSLRPFPQYLNVTHLENDGNSFYSALQTSLQRRWKDGVLQFSDFMGQSYRRCGRAGDLEPYPEHLQPAGGAWDSHLMTCRTGSKRTTCTAFHLARTDSISTRIHWPAGIVQEG